MDKNKVIVGISGSYIIDNGGMFPGYKRAYVNDDYVDSVVRAGGVPYIIPIVHDKEIIKEQLKNVDVLILSGGQDVNPLLWGEEPSSKLGEVLNIRDEFDIQLMKTANEMKMPVLGICRGEQIIAVANGGSLYQDISFIEKAYIKHNQGHSPNIPTHTVEIEKDSKLYEILGEKVITNSFHHLGVKDVPKGYSIVARSKDGVIEGIEKEGNHFVLGVQWHPEMMSKDNEDMLNIFKKLIDEGKKRK